MYLVFLKLSNSSFENKQLFDCPFIELILDVGFYIINVDTPPLTKSSTVSDVEL